jgi:hypothetical protein
MSTFSIDLTTQEITANFFIEGTTGGAVTGTVGVLNLDGNVSNVLRGDGTWGQGGSGGGTANVAGTTGQIQYNNAGQLGAITGASTDGTNLTISSSNLKLTGGANGQFLITDGQGNLSFDTVPGYVNIPRIELVGPSAATLNPTFTNPQFAYYDNDSTKMNIFVSGVLTDKDSWTLSGTTLTFNGWMGNEQQIDILPMTIATSTASIIGDIVVTSVTSGNVTGTNIRGTSANITGTATATYFKGDGSNLTNIPGGAFISNSTTSVSTLATGRVETKVAGTTAMAVDAAGIEVFNHVLPSANIVYDLGSPTRRFRDLYLSNNSIVLGDTTLSAPTGGGMSIDGSDIVTAQNDTLTIGNVVANYVSGNGSALSSITGANIVGNVSTATLAYAVDGANVIGNVSTALEAFRVDGANVIGNVSVAEVALGVEGANVIGNVATALEAFSVDSSNVVGLDTTINTAIQSVVGAAPSALNTLKELADSLDNDASFASTVTNALANKVSTSTYTAYVDGTANVIANLATSTQLSNGLGNKVESSVYNTFVTDTNNTLANLSQNVGNANLANFATVAFSVDGANVTGSVANATVAATVTVDGSAKTLGNVAVKSFSNNSTQWLNGNGTWANIAVDNAAGNTSEIQFNANGVLSSNAFMTFTDGISLKRYTGSNAGLTISSIDSTTVNGTQRDIVINRSGGNLTNPTPIANAGPLGAIIFQNYSNAKANYVQTGAIGFAVNSPNDSANTVIQSGDMSIRVGSRSNNGTETVENRTESVSFGSVNGNTTAVQLFAHTGRHYQSVFSHANNLAATTQIPDYKTTKARGFSTLEKQQDGTYLTSTTKTYPLQVGDYAFAHLNAGYTGNGVVVDMNSASGYKDTGYQRWRVTALPTGANSYFSTDYTLGVTNATTNAVVELKFSNAGLLDVPALRVNTPNTPASATATGTTGEIRYDTQFIYVCVATNTWMRSALSTW